MGTFFRAIIALIAAIFLGLGALLLVGVGVCALAATTVSMGVFEAGVVVGIIATLAFGIRVFISVFNALGDKPQPNRKRTAPRPCRRIFNALGDKPQPNSEENSPTPVPPHYYRDRAQRRKQREQENHDNAN
ncbi:MAG: hypothetical protein ACFNLD_07450 [Kingella oralis]